MKETEKSCSCALAQRLVGDGCEICNPAMAAEVAAQNAECQECGGTGYLMEKTSEARYVTREMAMDAECLDLEGALYSDEEWERYPCPECQRHGA